MVEVPVATSADQGNNILVRLNMSTRLSLQLFRSKAEDDRDLERDSDDDDEGFNPSNEVDVRRHVEFVRDDGEGGGRETHRCRMCAEGEGEFRSHKASEVEAHILSAHARELRPEEDDEEEMRKVEVEEEEDDDDYVNDDYLDDEEYGRPKRKKAKRGSGRSTNKRSRGDQGHPPARAFRQCLLNPTPEFIEAEAEFRKRNGFGPTKFEDLVTKKSDWRVLSQAEAASLAPGTSESLPYSAVSADSAGEAPPPKRLGLFRTSKDPSGVLTMYAGGPIWAAAWLPSEENEEEEVEDQRHYLALCTHRAKGEEASTDRPNRGIVQLWRFDGDESSGEMSLGIAHELLGRVWDLCWCPSGNSTGGGGGVLPRLGLLACACAGGAVPLFSICRPESLRAARRHGGAAGVDSRPVWSTTRPVRVLKVGDGDFGADCLSLSWFRGEGHRVLGAGFSDGSVALWNLKGSGLLLCGETDLFPYCHIRAHSSPVNSVDLSDCAIPGQPGMYLKCLECFLDNFPPMLHF